MEINTRKQHTRTQNLIACAHKKHTHLFYNKKKAIYNSHILKTIFGYHWNNNQVNPLRTFPPQIIRCIFSPKFMKEQGKGKLHITLQSRIKVYSFELSMSHQVKILLQEF